ncbi:prepilin-type N-terminal cleavage/methylation domain-containing protein [Castellaniella sp. GW247-6E4]|uniref:prepilin-type N-terminal cleavage/methylation domain-containing protein n=1 Tax=Castellaniella sp. GW247-6E4 TaxID=3140380 RepID=UPI003314F01D
MATSAPGPTKHQAGFTLLEMMVAVLIIGVATAVASVSVFGDEGARTLRRDADRLVELFAVAQAQARSSGTMIVWKPDHEGYAFAPLPRPMVLPARLAARRAASSATPGKPGRDSALRQRDWLSRGPVDVRLEPPDALVFDGEWIHEPAQVELRADGRSLRLSRLDGGRFVVDP